MSDTKRSILSLARDSFHYMVGLGLMGMANIVLVPLYARYMTPAEFGAYALIEVAALALLIVCGLGFGTSYLKWYAEARREDVPGLLGASLVTTAVSSLVIGLAFWMAVASPFASRSLEAQTTQFAWVLLPLLVLEAVQAVLQTHFRAERRPVAFSVCSLVRLGAITLFSVLFIVHYHLVLAGVFFGRAAGDAVGVLAMLLGARRDLKLRATWAAVRPMLRYGMPLILSSLILMVMDASGRYFLEEYGSLHDVGCYAVANKISGIMRLAIVAPFGAAWGGLMFQIAAREDAPRVFAKLSSYIALLAMSAALMFTLAEPILFRVFATPEYAPASTVIPLLLLVQAVSTLQYPAAAGLYLAAGTRWLVPSHLIALAMNVLLNIVLVPRFGMVGTAYAWLGTWVTLIVGMGLLARRIYPIPYELLSLVLAATIAAATLSWPLAGAAAVAVALGYIVRDVRRAS